LSFAEVEGALYAMSFVSDVSERVRAQQALQVYSERLEHLVEERTRELREAQDSLLAQQRLRQDLELAQQVQASLLPRHVPDLEGYEFAAAARPARYVSGDVYDFSPCDGEACHLVLADIAGKGVPAALLASTARTLMHAETEHQDSPAAVLDSVGRVLEEDLAHAEMYITAFAARLDVRLGRLTYANAGHTEALWWQDTHHACRRLPATGLPLGLAALLPDRAPGDEAGERLTETTIWPRPGDTLLFYSDGITEAVSPGGELYGAERLAALLAVKAALPAEELAQAIVAAVDAFCGGEPRTDDLTLIVLKVLPRSIAFRHAATLEHLDLTLALVRQVSRAFGQQYAYQMELATCEVVTNVMRHACGFEGQIRGRIAVRPDGVTLDLYDDGVACDLDALPAPQLGELREGGYGLHIARQLLDELSYTPATATDAGSLDAPAGNHWRLVKRAQEGPAHHAT
jgi:serine phosphatase RsbU (regulator of sigma subunit)/anti-sigma regulatory factor (Ser/Thr protein kinase)